MSSIDELHWSAILDTKDFDQKASKLRDDAKQLNKDLSSMLDIYSKFKGKTLITEKGVQNARDMSKVLSEIKQKMDVLPSSVKVFSDGTNNINKNLEETAKHYTTHSRLLRQLTTLAGTYFSVRGVQSFVKSLVDITGQFEVQKMALSAMLQSEAVADKIFNQYRQLALNSPYTFQDFTKFGKQLTAFNIPAKELVQTTKMLADVSAGLGVDMGRIILAYGQIKSAGVLKGTELRQLTEAGVPILESLSNQIKETTGQTVKLAEVFSMISKKQIPFEMVEQAFRDMTSEGGKFYNMQEVLVETLKGKIGKLRDVWQQALYDLGSGDSMNGILKGTIDLAIKLVSHLETIGKVLAPIIAGFGAYGAALAAVAIGQKALDLANFIRALIGVANGSKAAASALVAMGGAGKAAAASLGALAVAGVAIYEIVKAVNSADKEMREFKKSLDDVHEASINNNSYDKEIAEVTRLRDIVNDTTRSYDARKSALDKLETIIPSYHANLTNEGVLINNNKKAVDDYIESLKKEAKLKGAQDELTELYKMQRSQEKSVKDATTLRDKYQEDLNAYGINANAWANYATRLKEQKGVLDQEESKLIDINNRIKEIEQEIEDTTVVDATGAAATTLSDLLVGMEKTKKEIAELRKSAIKGGLTEAEEKRLATLEAELEKDEKRYQLFTGKKKSQQDKIVEKEDNEDIRRIKANISNLQHWKDIYDKLVEEALLGEEGAKSLMNKLFHVDDVDFKGQIEGYLNDLRNKFRDKNGIAEYIDSINASLGKDASKKLVDLLEAFKKLQEARDKWAGKDFSAEGTGALYDITKAVQDGVNKMQDATDKRKKNEALLAKLRKDAYKGDEESEKALAALKEALGEELWEKYVEQGTAAFDELETKERESAIAGMKDRITALAKTFAQEQVVGYDTSNLTRLSREQLKALYVNIWNSRQDGWDKLLQNEKLKKAVEDAGITLDDAQKNYNAFFDKLLDRIENEQTKKLVKNVQSVFKAFSGFGDSFRNLGEQTNNTFLKTLGDTINLAEQLASTLLENEKIFDSLFGNADDVAKTGDAIGDVADSADWITMILKVVLKLTEGIVDAIAKDYELQQELNEAASKYRETLRDIVRMRNEGYFGDDAIGLLADNWKLATDAVQKYKDTLAKDTGEATDVGSLNIFGGENIKRTYKSLSGLASQFPELFDANGNLNAAYLKSMVEVFKKGGGYFSQTGWWSVSSDLKLLLDDIVRVYDEMTSATEAFANSVKDIFGSLADTIANDFVDSFLETGDALSNLDKSFENFGESVARTMLKSLLSSNMMEKFGDNINEMAEKYVEVLASSDRESADMQFAEMIANLAGDMKEFAEGYGEFANAFLSNLQQNGLLGAGAGETSETLSNGIKGITEDTANLLASYINAVRADVSYLRMMNEAGWKDVNAILVGIGVIPTLNDYMAQVAATNANIAESNQQILAEIRGVISTASGRRAIAVDMQ